MITITHGLKMEANRGKNNKYTVATAPAKAASITRRIISALIRFGCIFTVLYVISYETTKYYKNEDASSIHVIKLGGVDWKTFPAITLCFQSGGDHVLDGLYNKSNIQSHLNISATEYRTVLLGDHDHKDTTNIVTSDFEQNTMNMRNYLKKFRIQDTNENEYIWEYDETWEAPQFNYVVNQQFGWIGSKNPTKDEVPLVSRYLDPKIKCFTNHPELDPGVSIDSIDFYFYISKLASIDDGKVYIYVHQHKQFIRNMRYLFKIRHFIGVSSENSNNQLVFDLMYARIVQNRADAKETCDEHLENDDEEWMKQAVAHVSCVPPYWKSVYENHNNYSLCTSKEKLDIASHFLPFKNEYGKNVMFENYEPPCHRMRVLANTNTDKYNKNGLLKIKFRFRYF